MRDWLFSVIMEQVNRQLLAFWVLKFIKLQEKSIYKAKGRRNTKKACIPQVFAIRMMLYGKRCSSLKLWKSFPGAYKSKTHKNKYNGSSKIYSLTQIICISDSLNCQEGIRENYALRLHCMDNRGFVCWMSARLVLTHLRGRQWLMRSNRLKVDVLSSPLIPLARLKYFAINLSSWAKEEFWSLILSTNWKQNTSIADG